MNKSATAERPHENDDAPLNPALKQKHDGSYGPDHNGTDPMESVSVQKDEGRAWPMIWAVVTIACIIIAILFVL